MSDEIPQTTQRNARFTVEMAVWGLVVAGALALRLANLDAAPLSAPEAREAMLAWRAATGQGMPAGVPVGSYSPLLFAANTLLFWLCDASDALARLLPALFGSALVLAPTMFRRHVGRVGALTAGLYLAISPTALFASRQLDGAVIAAAGGVALLGGLLRFSETGKRSWLILAAVSLPLAVTASPAAWGMLLALGLAWVGLSWAWPATGTPPSWQHLRQHLGHGLGAFLLASFAFATGLGWHLAGLGATGDLAAAWFARLALPATQPLALLAFYEPLALALWLVGLVRVALRGHRTGVLLGLWAGLGILTLALAPEAPAEGVWVVVPLALVAGLVIESAAQRVQRRRATEGGRSGWLYVLAACVLWIYLYLRVARYAAIGDPNDLFLALLGLVFPLVLLALAASIFALTTGVEGQVVEELTEGGKAALRGFLVGTGIVLLVATVAGGWGGVYARPAAPQELLTYEPTDVNVRDLVQTLRTISVRETGLPMALPLVYEAEANSVLAWYLRDFSAAQRFDSLADDAGPEIITEIDVVVTQQRKWPLAIDEDIGFSGQDFILHRSWTPQASLGCLLSWPPCRPAIDWLLFRQSPTEPDQWAVIWLRFEKTGGHRAP